MKINLKALLKNIVNIDAQSEREISGISLDSRTIKPGELFIAYVGDQFDGRKYIHEAIKRGAAAIVYEAENQTVEKSAIPMIAVEQLRKYVGVIAARFFGDPSQTMTLIGITGTNGKTSCSQFIAKTLQMAGKSCGIIGTLGFGFPDKLQLGSLTTPDALTLQQELADLKHQGAQAVAMEVTSHSLVQDRVQGIHFNTAVFTNLTRDHLDYHGNMINYANAKRKLFENPDLQYAVINLDDPYGLEYLQTISKNVKTFGYTLKENASKIPTVSAQNIQITPQGFSAEIKTPWGEGQLNSKLMGRFNLSNLLAVLSVLCLMEIPLEKVLQYIAALDTVPGRMQVFGGKNKPTVIVDYAHTPDALEQALRALREHCKGKLCCVFGCGGERDRGKRPMMAQVAERYSDKVIVTDDNPRREYSQKIIEDIMQGFLYPQAVTVIPDRREAIAQTIKSAQTGDVILIAGKGHEPYQIIGTEKIHFSDAEEVQQQLNIFNE